MLCEHYKEALTEAAARGAQSSGDLRAHLASCAACCVVFEQEQALFASIDGGLQVVANAEVPASLLPRVRARLDEAVVPRSHWVQPLIFASASVALAFGVFLMARSHRATPENIAGQDPVVTSTSVTPRAKMNPGKIPLAGTQTASMQASHSHGVRNSTTIHSAASSNPEVLVPPDEREAFARFLGRDQALATLASVSVAWAPKPPRESVEILPVEIASLAVTPLNKDEDNGQQTEF
jgi:anti-sigma factor RsiW